jgi:quinol monooxygenase YgiN
LIALTGRLVCSSTDDAETVQKLLPAHIRLSRAEPGCLSFSVVQTADPLVWRLDETFRDRAAFEAHQARTRASDWYRATAHLKRDYQISED